MIIIYKFRLSLSTSWSIWTNNLLGRLLNCAISSFGHLYCSHLATCNNIKATISFVCLNLKVLCTVECSNVWIWILLLELIASLVLFVILIHKIVSSTSLVLFTSIKNFSLGYHHLFFFFICNLSHLVSLSFSFITLLS